MIIFLNFAPFNFGGGAERWMLDVSSAVNKLEATYLVDVHSSIANIYGRLVLKRKFNKRLNIETKNNVEKHISLSLYSLLPFTFQWRQSKADFKKARLIYIRYELLEVIIVLYMGGISALKKTIAGMHSPFIYQNPITFFDHLHNYFYGSKVNRWFLSQMTKIHAINPLDYKIFTEKLHLKNVVQIPNFINMNNYLGSKNKKIDRKNLHIAFIGELNLRKGVDILLEAIKKSPDNYIFHVAGDGPMREAIEQLTSYPNLKYYGYLSKQGLTKIYANCDILFSPSRAESFPLAVLEGLSYGLSFVSSSNTLIGLPTSIQIVNTSGTTKQYLKIFENFLIKKRERKLDSQKGRVKEYTRENFSRDIILVQLFNKLLGIKNHEKNNNH